MKCCINCFKDLHIRETIENYGIIGDCDFCSSKDISVSEISNTPNDISEMILALIQIYSVAEDVSAKFLKEVLRDDWDIFSGGSEVIQALTIALCSPEIAANSDIFTHKVNIPQLSEAEFLTDYGVVGELTWKEFSNSIKYNNRFHSNKFNPDVFASFLSTAVTVCPEGTHFFRARIAQNSDGFSADDMYGPPKEKRCAGRVNPEDIGVLYLSSDEKTVLNETRVNAYDYVTIGTFRTKQKIRIVNLSNIAKISPFMYTGDLERFAANRKVFQEIALEIAKPLRRSDSILEYLPTQFISEFVKSQGYDGVAYESTLRRDGYNLALFNEKLAECIDVKTVEVTNIKYSIK